MKKNTGENVTIKCSGLVEARCGYSFKIYQLCSLVTLNRAFEVCNKRPLISFEENLLAKSFVCRSKSPAIEHIDDDFINQSQRQAILAFVNLKTGLQLLQGPPGTGKTTTIVAAINSLIANGETVLVCAPSNKAVQVIAKRFLKNNLKAPIIIAGREEKLEPELETIFLDSWKNNILKELKTLMIELESNISLLESQKESAEPLSLDTALVYKSMLKFHTAFGEILDKVVLYKIYLYGSLKEGRQSSIWFNQIQAQDLSLQIAMANLKVLNKNVLGFQNNFVNITEIDAYLLNSSKVIFSTLSFAGQQRMGYMDINSLIIDEAAQATEAETIIPFQHCPSKCLLVGDINQLSAIVKSEVAKINNYGWSMMHRLQVEAGYPHHVLNIQYRMHQTIRSWPSTQFYANKLQDGPNISIRPDLVLPKQIYPYSFIDIKGKEKILHNSKKNEAEAKFVIKLLKFLQNKNINLQQEVGIITFYSGQVERINQGIRDAKLHDINAQTVDGFQGEEKDIIIISFVRANKNNTVGFLGDFRRLNVAITRAKRALIMLGDSRSLRKNEYVSSMIDHIIQTNSLYKAKNIENEVFVTTSQMANTKIRRKSKRHLQKEYWQELKNKPLIPIFQAELQLWQRYEKVRKEEESNNKRVKLLLE